MNKLFVFMIMGFLLVWGMSFIYYSSEDTVEDINSYNIKDRYDCKKIQDDKKYNDCVSFYLKNSPYKLGDILVPIRK